MLQDSEALPTLRGKGVFAPDAHSPGAVRRAWRLRSEHDAWVRSQGYEVLRIKNHEAFADPHGVVDRVTALISSRGMTS